MKRGLRDKKRGPFPFEYMPLDERNKRTRDSCRIVQKDTVKVKSYPQFPFPHIIGNSTQYNWRYAIHKKGPCAFTLHNPHRGFFPIHRSQLGSGSSSSSRRTFSDVGGNGYENTWFAFSLS